MSSGDTKVSRTLPIDSALLADVLLRLRRDADGSVLRWTLGGCGAAEIDVQFFSDGDAWTFTGRVWNDGGLVVTNVRLRVEAASDDAVLLTLTSEEPVSDGDGSARALVDELSEELLWHATRAGIAAKP
jgi:hypothetical protein